MKDEVAQEECSRKAQSENNNSVGFNSGSKIAIERTEILMLPQISDSNLFVKGIKSKGMRGGEQMLFKLEANDKS